MNGEYIPFSDWRGPGAQFAVLKQCGADFSQPYNAHTNRTSGGPTGLVRFMGVTCDPDCAQWATAFDDCVCTNKAGHAVIEV